MPANNTQAGRKADHFHPNRKHPASNVSANTHGSEKERKARATPAANAAENQITGRFIGMPSPF